MSGRAPSGQALAVPAEPSCTVSALTGFDPSRKDQVFQVSLDIARRRASMFRAEAATNALRWLYQYGKSVAGGGTYGIDFSGFDDASPYLQEARQAFGHRIYEDAVSRALSDVDREVASAIEARSDATTQIGAAEGESAAPQEDAQ